MKIIVKEHINSIATPEVKEYHVEIDRTGSYNVIPAMIGLQKGDLLVYKGEGNIARLPVGADGTVLTADSTSELGVKWA